MDDTNLKSKSDRHRRNVSMYVHIKCPTFSAGSNLVPRVFSLSNMAAAGERTGTEHLSRENWVPHDESPPVRSLRVEFFEKIQKRIYDLRSYGFVTTKKTEDPKKDHLLCQRHVLVLLERKKNSNHKPSLAPKTKRKSNIS